MLSNNMATIKKTNKSRVNLCFLATNYDTWSLACGIWCGADNIHKHYASKISDVIFRKFSVNKSAEMY